MRRKKSAEIFKHELVNYGSTNKAIDVYVLGTFFSTKFFSVKIIKTFKSLYCLKRREKGCEHERERNRERKRQRDRETARQKERKIYRRWFHGYSRRYKEFLELFLL